MRIAYLTTTLDETVGWGRYAAGFLSEARRRNGKENVIAPDPARLRSTEIRWYQPFAALADAWMLRKELKDADVIHAAIEPAAPLAFFLSILLRKPYVVSVCGTFADLRSYSKAVRWLYRLAFRHAGRMAVLSRYTLKVFEQGMQGAKTTIVYGGFVPADRAERKTSLSGERRIVAVGAIKQRKGFHTLVEAFGLLDAKGFAFRADCIGPKDPTGYAVRVEERMKELGLADRVRFTGRVPEEELNAAYAGADLFVLPSEHDGTAFEGLGLVYLEAMTYGLPVIGCLDSGAEDIIKDGENGFLVPPGDPEKLAAAIERVLTDEALWKRMSEAAPASIDRFRWETVGADMDAAYKEAISAYGR
jgi:glycosyltransferase involved in cell wall biosynthesis